MVAWSPEKSGRFRKKASRSGKGGYSEIKILEGADEFLAHGIEMWERKKEGGGET